MNSDFRSFAAQDPLQPICSSFVDRWMHQRVDNKNQPSQTINFYLKLSQNKTVLANGFSMTGLFTLLKQLFQP